MDWNATQYDSNFGYVSAHGRPVVALLAARPGETVLDLGCGTGDLAAEIAAAGARVRGIDGDPEMVRLARDKHAGQDALTFDVADGHDFTLDEPVDAVFSNAALHWMTRPDEVVASVRAALRPGGRFVAEFGGRGNVAALVGALRAAAADLVPGVAVEHPWYFPSVAEHAARLERGGFDVHLMAWFERPTPLAPGDTAADWFRMFGAPMLEPFPEDARPALLARVDDLLRDRFVRDGVWYADYARLRFAAVRAAERPRAGG
jgi:trans-aconitate methyltransferase